ncbi:Uncharacterised protein [BD1-7 clade bacterium]|uniref:Uncharacterized protein n=1 Tax=BD1-7 clade bacterium TaxID=2029982 RepID=A0A5S9P4W2_9GAMM|nr:Uncharacterised protein [BD1-7 clade bacterium]CAA0098625.1 Uncharacterised protein [BD1-7 clade bacterium]
MNALAPVFSWGEGVKTPYFERTGESLIVDLYL